MITLYGHFSSSAGRCYWLLEELGLPYETKILDMQAKEQKKPEYLALNPNGKVPTLIDDGFVVWESYAINQYLVEKYRPELLGHTVQDHGLVYQWSYWSLLHLQKYFEQVLYFVRYQRGTLEASEKAKEDVKPFLAILENHLIGKDYMTGNTFTLADINVGSVVNLGIGLQYDMSPYPNTMRWMTALKARPAMKRLLEKMGK